MQISCVEAQYDHGLPWAEAVQLLDENKVSVERFADRNLGKAVTRVGFYQHRFWGTKGSHAGKRKLFSPQAGWQETLAPHEVPLVCSRGA